MASRPCMSLRMMWVSLLLLLGTGKRLCHLCVQALARLHEIVLQLSSCDFAGGMERSIYFGPNKLKDLYHFDHFM